MTGGQTVVNPWMTMGGVATSVCSSNEFIMSVGKFCLYFQCIIVSPFIYV